MKDDAPPFATKMANKAARSMQQDGSGAKKKASRKYTAIQALFDNYKTRTRFNKLPFGIMVEIQATALFKTFVNFCPARVLPQSETFAFRLNEWTVFSVSYYNGENDPYRCRYLMVQIIRYDTNRTKPYLVGAVEFFESLDRSTPAVVPNVVLGGQAPIHGLTSDHARDFSQAIAVLDDLQRAVRTIETDYESAKLAVVAYLQRQRKRQKRRGEPLGDPPMPPTASA